MKTTMMFRPIANPRRTTLAHLADDGAATAPRAETEPPAALAEPLPAITANPRRTTLMEIPTA